MKRQKGTNTIATCLALLLAACCMLWLAACGASAIATLEGSEITKDELEFYADQERSAVRNYFSANHQVTLETDDMWSQAFGGEVPRQVLWERALERCLDTRATLLLGRQYGLDVPVDYTGLKEAVKAENDARSQALANGEIVYGKQSFTVEEYLGHLLTNTRNDLIGLMSENGEPLFTTDDEVKQYFEAHQDEWSAGGTTMEVTEAVLAAPLTAQQAAQVQTLMEDGADADALLEAFPEGLAVSQHTFTAATNSVDVRARYDVLMAAGEMQPGEVRVVETGDIASVVRLDAREFDSETAYTEYADRIQAVILEEKFEAYCAAYRASLDYTLDENAFEKLYK